MKKKIKRKLTIISISIVVITFAVILEKYQIIDIKKYLNSTENISQNESDVGTESENEIDDINDSITANDTLYEVVRVVDGDTFVINYNGKQERVRLIGIDTPESVHPDEEKNTEFGDTVSNYSKEMLTGKQVALEFDVDERDQYGRLLAYVYLDGQMYNKMLLEKGYAIISTYPPNVKCVKDFTEVQKQARENKVGLWAY